MTLLPEVESALMERAEAISRARRPWHRGRRSRGPRVRLIRRGLVALVLASLLVMTTIALAATGVILTGAAVRPAGRPSAGVATGIPVPGGSRLLPLRAADPAGGLPWGMRVVRTTRGLVCVQIGRIAHGVLGELGVGGAFNNDGRLHPLPPQVLPAGLSSVGGANVNCVQMGQTFAGSEQGVSLSAELALRSAAAPGGRNITYGLLGPDAVSVTYRSGARRRTISVQPGLGAYLIVQPATVGQQLSSGATFGIAGHPSFSASPNGALTAITYRAAGRLCVDTARQDFAQPCPGGAAYSLGAPRLPNTHQAIQVHLRISHRVIVAAEIGFTAPYPVTDAGASYEVTVKGCGHQLAMAGTDRNISSGATVTVPVGDLLGEACGRSVPIAVEYVRTPVDAVPTMTTIGTTVLREPPGTRPRPVPLPRRRGRGAARPSPRS